MTTATRRAKPTTPSEDQCLRRLQIRLIRRREKARWDRLIRQHHYLHDSHLAGQTLRYVVTLDGRWVALLGWTSASLHLKPRDRWIGWSTLQRERRLGFLAQNARFLILPGVNLPNLATRALKLCLDRLSRDWQATWHHPIWIVETFVDPQRFTGTSYKAAGWQPLGLTSGFGRHGSDYYLEHGQPKQLWVRELEPKARARLAAPELPAPFRPFEHTPPLRCRAKVPQLQSLRQVLAGLPEPRSKKEHPLEAVLGIATVAVLSGATSYRECELVGQRLSQDQRRALRCRWDEKTHRFQVPSDSTFQRVLSALDAPQFERRLADWLAALDPQHDAWICLDGKTLRGSRDGDDHPLHLFSALTHGSLQFLGQVPVAQQTNEIRAVQPLLEPLPLAGRVVTLDALHTQQQTARYLVFERDADYLLPLKDNQKLLQRRAARLLPDSFPPSIP